MSYDEIQPGIEVSKMSHTCYLEKPSGGKLNQPQAHTSGIPTIQKGKGRIDDLIGATYQQQLLVLMVCHLAKLIEGNKKLNFTVTCDDSKAGIFDDIGFRFNDDAECGALLIQAKHKENKNNTVTWDDLTSMEKRAPFAISKYLDSFLQEREKWDEQNEQPVLVLCTNIELAEEVKTAVVKYKFGESIVDSVLKSITRYAYQIDLNIHSRLYDHLKENSEFVILAKQIALHIYHEKKVDFRKPLLQKYRYIIENNIAKDKKSKGPECYEVNKVYFDENLEFKKEIEKEYKLQYMLKDIKTKGIFLETHKGVHKSGEDSMSLQNTHFDELAKMLAQHIYKEETVSFEKPLLESHRQFIEKHIAISTHVGKKRHEVNTSFFDDTRFWEFTMVFKEEYLKMLEKYKYYIWDDIRDKGICLKKDISTEKCDLPKQLQDEALENFFERFIIICNTNHEESAVVANILKNKLLPVEMHGFISSEITYDKLAISIWDWMKTKSDHPLTKVKIVDMFQDIKSSLHYYTQSKVKSHAYYSEMGNMKLKYKLEGNQLFSNVQDWPEQDKNKENRFNGTQALTFDAHTIQMGKGMLNHLIGATYQQHLLVLMVCHLATLIEENKKLNFTVTCEDPNGGIFDDIGLRFNDDAECGVLLIQAKYKEKKEKTITWEDLTSMEKKAPFAISKYLDSFLQEREKWDEQNEQPVLVLCTNIELAEEVKTAVVKYQFGESIVDSVLKSITRYAYQIDLNIHSRLYDHLKENSEFVILAKQIALHIYHEKKVDFRKPLLQKYRYVIENKIAKEKKSKGIEYYEVNEVYFDENIEFKKEVEKQYQFQYMLNDIKTKGILLETDKRSHKFEKHFSLILQIVYCGALAKMLAHHIYKQKTVSFENPLFKKHRQFIQHFAIATQEESKRHEVNTSFFDHTRFWEFTMVFQKEYLKMYEKAKDKIWDDIRAKGICLKKDTPTEKCDLPKQLQDEELEKFFERFIILCNINHKGSTVVANILKNKLLPAELHGFISSEITYNKLAMSVLDWMKTKTDQPLSNIHIVDLFKYIKSSLRCSKLKGMSQKFYSEMGYLDLEYMSDKVEGKKLYQKLQDWLKKAKNKENRFDVTFERCSNLALIFAVLKQSKGEWEHLFLKSDWLIKPQNSRDCLTIFRAMKFTLILVLDCKQQSDIDYLDWVQGWLENESFEYRRMILIVDQSMSPFPEEDIFIADLTEQSREYVFQQKIMLCGTVISNQELFQAGDSLNMVQNVKKLPDGTSIKRNIYNESFEKINKMYIARIWSLCSTESAAEMSSEDFWRRKWMAKVIPVTITSGASDDIIIDDFLELIGSRNIRYDHIIDDKTQEQIDPPGFETNISENAIFKSSSGFDEMDNKVHVILNEAGSGKTFYMTWLAKELQTRLSSKTLAAWVIKFNLSEYSNDFDQFQNNHPDTEGKLNAVDAIRQLFQLIYLNFVAPNKCDPKTDEKRKQAQEVAQLISFSKNWIRLDETKSLTTEQFVVLKIFLSKFNNRKIVILMDGFDEVTPHYKDAALNLLSVLATFEGIRKIYLTSRPYGLRTELQSAFKVCSFYRLVEFNSDNQCKYIHRFLLEKFDRYKSLEKKDQEKMFQIITRLLVFFFENLMKVPLFLYMGLELLITLIKKHIDPAFETISKTIMEECEQTFAPLNMIDLFVEKKLEIAFVKIGAINADTATKLYIDREIARLKNIFSRLALFTVMNEEVNTLLSDDDQEGTIDYMDKIRNGSEKSGICEGVINNVPLFIHRLFAEYFAALWFYNQTCNQKKRDKVRDFIKHRIFETNERKEIKFFLDSMICKGKQLHMAILGNSISKVTSLLETNPGSFNESDAWGRTPLHLAVAYGSKENDDIVCLLLKSADQATINSKDTYFEWSALDYAHVSDKLNGKGVYFELYFVLKLLKTGASINNDETFTRFRSEDVAEMFAAALPFAFHLTHELVPTFGQSCTTNIMENLFDERVQQSEPDFNMQIPIDKLFEMFESYNSNLANKAKAEKINQGQLPLLQLCSIADSPILDILFKNSINKTVKTSLFCKKESMKLAFEFRSINLLRYCYTKYGRAKLPEPVTFEQEMLLLLIFMHEDEQMFKSSFHEYCTQYKITCLEENGSPQSNEVATSDVSDKRVSLQGELWRYFPVEFKIRSEIGIDSGTEFLLSRALQANVESIVKYLVQKTKITVNNQIIKNTIKNCQTGWRCQTSFHSFIKTSSNLTSGDETGRTLLHFAVEQGRFNLVKCLIEHNEFKATDRNASEKNWNAFFYCVCEDSEYSDLRKNIFTYIMQKNASYDCFSELDFNEKSVFYYAVKNNQSISDYIIKQKFSIRLKDFDAGQIRYLVQLLKSSGFNAEEMLVYLSNIFFEDATLCKNIIQALQENNMLDYTDQKNRNILHISIRNNWVFLVISLVETFDFDVLKVNGKEKNWNSFFYCVSEKTSESTAIRNRIFLYLLEQKSDVSVDFLDTDRRSVFFYATKTNTEIAKIIFKRQCKRTENLSIERRISVLLKMLQNTTLNAYQKMQYLEENNLIDEIPVQSICEYIITPADLSFKDEKTGRNLLQIAITNGWFLVTECLIDHYKLELKTINENEFNWNAFFYCVSNTEKPTEKLNIFTYLMEKHSMDCFDQLDSNAKCVFWYATCNNNDIGMQIFKRQCDLTVKQPNDERIWDLMGKLENGLLNGYEKLQYLEENNLVDEMTVKIICYYMETTGDLSHIDEVRGRNLLHLAIWEGWIILAKCLIEHYRFDAMKINEKEKNWNAFFYCVSNKRKPTEKLNLLIYLLGKYEIDCFNQLDSEGKSVFWHATKSYTEFANEIFLRECQSTRNLPWDDQASHLLCKLQKSLELGFLEAKNGDSDSFYNDVLS